MNQIPDPFAELIERTRNKQRSESEEATRIIRRPERQTDQHDGGRPIHSPAHSPDQNDHHGESYHRSNQLPIVHGNVANLLSAFISLFLFLLFIFCGLGAFIATCFWR